MLRNWRTQLERQIPALPADAQIVVHGLLARFGEHGCRRTGAEALDGCTREERRAVWALCFPAVQEEVERAWHELPVMVMTRRDGGSDGHGERFTWPPDAATARAHRFTWLRKLLLLTGPYPEAGLTELLSRSGEMIAHLAKSRTVQFDDLSGHFYDSDAPAYLALPILNHGGPEGEACLEVLRAVLTGAHPTARLDRGVITALLCCERPDAWQFVDDQLAAAGLDEGFRSHLFAGRIGIHPNAWRYLHAAILRERLWRFPSGRQFLDRALGIAWQWDAAPGIEHWLGMTVRFHEGTAGRAAAFREGDAPALFLALFALAVDDGPAALAQAAALLGDPIAERRLASAWFLSLCPGEHRAEPIARLIDDTDVRVRALAVETLNTHGTRCPRDSTFFSRLEGTLAHWPAALPASPAPWPAITTTRDDATELLIDALPSGEEERVRPWLRILSKAARQRLIKRLNRFEQTPTHHALLFHFFSDPDFDIAEHAVKAARGQALTADELAQVEASLASKQTTRRRLLIDLILRQLPATAVASARRLLTAGKIPQRLAGLELLRRFATRDELRSKAAEIAQELPLVENPSADENRALTELRALPSPIEQETPPTTANAFGLVDPATLPKYPPPQDRGVLLHSPNTVALLHEMDALLAQNAEVEFTTFDYGGHPKQITIAKDGVPTHFWNRAFEENRRQFPLLTVWEQWWKSRPAACRDADGFEFERMSALLSAHESLNQHPRWLEILHGVSSLTVFRNRTHQLQNLLCWLHRRFRPPGLRAYILDAAETALARLPGEKEKVAANQWISRARECVFPHPTAPDAAEVTDEEMARFWRLAHVCAHAEPYYFVDVLRARARGVATDDEFIWQLLGEIHGRRVTRNFGDLKMATTPAWTRRFPELERPEIFRLVERCRDRILELELRRGEEATPATLAARSIDDVPGVEWLIRCCDALGGDALLRSHLSNDASHAAVCAHLISKCRPAPGDRPEAFAELARGAGLVRERLVEIAIFTPQWAPFVAAALDAPALPDAVNWIHAHTKTPDWRWQIKTQELWAGELGRLTRLTADELLAGAVDVEWFQRAHAAVGPELWARLYDAAKYACTGAGHTRVRLFADALLGRVSVEELTGAIHEKRSQEAVRALGLVPLPKSGTKRRSDLLRRYRVLAEFRHGSAKAKAQRRASEELAARIGLDNLARAAGHSNPERFAWAMETEAAADLAAGPLRAQADDVIVTLEVTPAGKLEVAASRAGKPLKAVPVGAKKHPEVAALLERREEARDQVARMRPALEDLMVRGLPLAASEWRGLMRHPFVAPLLRRLVLTAETGPLGFPAEDGASLVDAAGALQPWPEDVIPLRIAHPGDLPPAERWHTWQRACFDRQITQPFKQVFRELYVPVENERGPHGESLRYEGHAVQPAKALALLGKRSWVHHPDEGMHRVFHDAGIVAWLDFGETFYRASELSSLAITRVRFCTKAGRPVPLDQVPARVFSEAMRDVDLIVSVAHLTGVDPETSRSSLDMRAALVRETCRLLRFDNVFVEPPVARIAGQRGNYRVHLGSGVVHLSSGRMVYLQPVANTERLFLPFADDDPKLVEILSKVLWLAEDGRIKDPGFLAQTRA